jgi:hypothetical protein
MTHTPTAPGLDSEGVDCLTVLPDSAPIPFNDYVLMMKFGRWR